MAPAQAAIGINDVSHLQLKMEGKSNGVNGHRTRVQDVRMESKEKTRYVLASYRALIADLCQQFNMVSSKLADDSDSCVPDHIYV